MKIAHFLPNREIISAIQICKYYEFSLKSRYLAMVVIDDAIICVVVPLFTVPGGGLSSCFPHGHGLFISISSPMSIPQSSSYLPVLGQIESSNLLSLFNLLLVSH